MRWQHLSIRGEEREVIPEGETVDSLRKVPAQFMELGEDEMPQLARHCREAGLELLFLTSMKICDRKNADVDTPQPSARENENDSNRYTYGALVHIDHMNDGKGYREWLRKACKTTGCSLLIRQCYSNNDSDCVEKSHAKSFDFHSSRHHTIYVGIFGDEDGVRQVVKRWRTSFVDVDSRNKPCLERMMKVLEEGKLNQSITNDMLKKRELLLSQSLDDESNVVCLFNDLERIIGIVDNNWDQSLKSHFFHCR